MMKGDHGPTKMLHALTWDAFDHASHAPQVRTCNYYVCVSIYMCECVCVYKLYSMCLLCVEVANITSSPELWS